MLFLAESERVSVPKIELFDEPLLKWLTVAEYTPSTQAGQAISCGGHFLTVNMWKPFIYLADHVHSI